MGKVHTMAELDAAFADAPRPLVTAVDGQWLERMYHGEFTVSQLESGFTFGPCEVFVRYSVAKRQFVFHYHHLKGGVVTMRMVVPHRRVGCRWPGTTQHLASRAPLRTFIQWCLVNWVNTPDAPGCFPSPIYACPAVPVDPESIADCLVPTLAVSPWILSKIPQWRVTHPGGVRKLLVLDFDLDSTSVPTGGYSTVDGKFFDPGNDREWMVAAMLSIYSMRVRYGFDVIICSQCIATRLDDWLRHNRVRDIFDAVLGSTLETVSRDDYATIKAQQVVAYMQDRGYLATHTIFADCSEESCEALAALGVHTLHVLPEHGLEDTMGRIHHTFSDVVMYGVSGKF